MKITIAGDFTTTGRGDRAIKDNSAISQGILDVLQSSDFNIVNLESPVANDECVPIKKAGPHLKTSTDALKYLKNSGFHAVTLANNHFCDYGEKGVELTIEQLEKNGLKHIGGGRAVEEFKMPLFYSHSEDGTIAFLNYCEHEFSIQEGYGSNPLNLIHVYNDIQKVKKQSDIVVVIVHGGSEGYQLPTPRMQELYRWLIDIGASVVVNHHQHCYSGSEDYHNGHIFYGLGNFFFDSEHEINSIWNDGYLVQIEICDKKISQLQLIPYEQCQNNVVQVQLLHGDRKESFMKDIERLNQIISDENKLEDAFLIFCQKKGKNYWSAFSPYSNRYLRYICKHGLLPSFITNKKRFELINYLECESHRDITLHALKNY